MRLLMKLFRVQEIYQCDVDDFDGWFQSLIVDVYYKKRENSFTIAEQTGPINSMLCLGKISKES